MSFYRRNLPHWHPDGKSIFITWRLYGSLPASVLRRKSTGRNACATNTSESEDSLMRRKSTGKNACATHRFGAAPEDSPGTEFFLPDAALHSSTRGPLWLTKP